MSNRKFVLPAAELIDRLSVDQIKEMLFDDNSSITDEINVHIWYLKDKMQENEDRYDDLLKLAHQINGVRNRMKNLLLEEFGDKEKSLIRSNFDTDGLKGWEPSL